MECGFKLVQLKGMTMKMRMRSIIWNEEEKRKVARASWRILKEPGSRGYKLTALLCGMKEVLPANKWRNIRAIQSVPYIQDYWNEFEKQEKDKLSKSNPADQCEIAPIPDSITVQPEVTSSVSPDSYSNESSKVESSSWPPAIIPGKLPREDEKHVSTRSLLDEISSELLAQELLSRVITALSPDSIRKIVREEINSVLTQRFAGSMFESILAPEETVKPLPKDKHAETSRLLKICVIGLLPGQISILKKEYESLVDFHFLEGKEGHKRIKNTAELMDHTFKTIWCKGNLSGLKLPNCTHANSMDSIRVILRSKFSLDRIN